MNKISIDLWHYAKRCQKSLKTVLLLLLLNLIDPDWFSIYICTYWTTMNGVCVCASNTHEIDNNWRNTLVYALIILLTFLWRVNIPFTAVIGQIIQTVHIHTYTGRQARESVHDLSLCKESTMFNAVYSLCAKKIVKTNKKWCVNESPKQQCTAYIIIKEEESGMLSTRN